MTDKQGETADAEVGDDFKYDQARVLSLGRPRAGSPDDGRSHRLGGERGDTGRKAPGANPLEGVGHPRPIWLGGPGSTSPRGSRPIKGRCDPFDAFPAQMPDLN
jgi:hypothetical protein